MQRHYFSLLSFALLSCLTFSAPSDAKMRIAIIEFANNATAEVTDAVRRGITDMLTTAIVNTNAFSVFERSRLEAVAREQRLSMSGLVDSTTVAKVGRLVGVDVIVTGAVTEFSSKMSGGLLPLPIAGISGIAVGNSKATVRLDVRAIKVDTGEVVFASRETGTADRSLGGVMISGLAYGQGETGGVLSAAVYNAVTKIASSLRRALGAGASNHVLSNKAGVVVIDAGMSVGIEKGRFFTVYAEGSPVLGLKGEVLGVERNIFAVLKVEEVFPAWSRCSVLRMESTPERGDMVEMLTGNPDGVSLIRRRSNANTLLETVSGPLPEPTKMPEPKKKPGPKISEPETKKKPEPTQVPIPTKAPKSARESGVELSSDQSIVLDYMGLTQEQKSNILIVHNAGYHNLSRGNASRALKQFEKAVEIFGGNYLDMYWAGIASSKLGRHGDAKKWMRRALETKPGYVPAQEFLDGKRK